MSGTVAGLGTGGRNMFPTYFTYYSRPAPLHKRKQTNKSWSVFFGGPKRTNFKLITELWSSVI